MSIRLGTLAGLVTLAACLFTAAAPARAQIGSERYSAIVLDHRTGGILVAANADETRHPASLTKMMTLYLVFEALSEGRLSLASAVPTAPVRLVDERLSTVSAQSALHRSGRSTRGSRAVIDQVAAVVILQHAIDSERSSGTPAGSALEPNEGRPSRDRRPPEPPRRPRRTPAS